MEQSIRSFRNADFMATVAVFIVRKTIKKRYINDSHILSIISHSSFQPNRIYIVSKMGEKSSSENMFLFDDAASAHAHYLSLIDKCKFYVKDSAESLSTFIEKLENLTVVEE